MNKTKVKRPPNNTDSPIVEIKDDQAKTTNLAYSVKTTENDLEKLKLHRDFLKSLETEENNRLTLLENKATQLVSQTGIIFALMSLFIPLIIDKIDDFYLKLLIFIPLALAFLFYLLTIHHAAKNFNLSKFVYSRSDAKNVITHKDNSAIDFLVEEINDLLDSIRKNTDTNNDKASNLIKSYSAFRIAIILTAILGIALCSVLLFTTPKKEPITIKDPIKIENVSTNSSQSH